MAYVSLLGLVNDNYPENRTLRVRIIHIHGLPDNMAESEQGLVNHTKDEDLPIIPNEIPSYIPESAYGRGALVRVEFPAGELSSARVSRVVRTPEEMERDIPQLISVLRPIESPEVTLNTITDAVNRPQETIEGTPGYGASDQYIEEYKTFFGYPFTNYYPITSVYGYRQLGDGSSGFHAGIDLGVPSGIPIYAVADGTVVDAFGNWSRACGIENMRSYGNYVTIEHNVFNGIKYFTHYAHMQSICVNVGDKVYGTQMGNEGTQIGIVGHTGHCYPDNEQGSHLHFEILNDISWHNSTTTFNPITRIDFINNHSGG